jgi:hypothetical protein
MRALGIDGFSPAGPAGGRGRDVDRPVHGARPAPSPAAAGLRLRTFLRRRALDRRLAAGCGVTSPELALRARQLTDPRARRELAGSLRGVLRCAEGTPALRPAVTLDRTAVKYGRAALADLADQLELAQNVTPRGVLLARRLMTDGRSPVYNANAERTVAEVAREIQDALLVRPPAAPLAV